MRDLYFHDLQRTKFSLSERDFLATLVHLLVRSLFRMHMEHASIVVLVARKSGAEDYIKRSRLCVPALTP